MKLYTYYDDVSELNLLDETKLILLWQAHWKSKGVEPILLNEYVAREHEDFKAVEERLKSLPTVNPKHYELSCYLRWLALSVAGGGWMMDYDVFTVLPRAKFSTPPKGDVLHVYQSKNICPSFVHATPAALNKLIEAFMTGRYGKRAINGQEHWSDMYCIEDLVLQGDVDWIKTHDFVKGYGDEGWQKGPLVHFSNGSMVPRGKTPRWQHIRTILEEAIHEA